MFKIHRKKRWTLLALVVITAGIAAVAAFAYFSAGSGSAETRNLTGPTNSSAAFVLAYNNPDCFSASGDTSAVNNALEANGAPIRCSLMVTNPATNSAQSNIVVSENSPNFTATPAGCPTGSVNVTFGDTATAVGGTSTYTIPTLAPGASFGVYTYLRYVDQPTVNQDACAGAIFKARVKATVGP
jgi:hypothetical protein